MSQLYTDFRNDTTDALPSGWTSQWSSTNVSWLVKENSSDSIHGKRLERTGTATTGWHGLSFVDSTADAEILVRFNTSLTQSTLTDFFSVVFRGSGAAGSETGYQVKFGRASGSVTVRIVKIVAGTTTVKTSAGQTLSEYGNYIRVQISGSAIKYRMWRTNQAEPVTWNLQTTDTSISAAGWVGLAALDCRDTVSISYVGVGTGSDVAPLPVTATRTIDFIGQTIGDLPQEFTSQSGSTNPWQVVIDGESENNRALKAGHIETALTDYSGFEHSLWVADGFIQLRYRIVSSINYARLWIFEDPTSFDPADPGSGQWIDYYYNGSGWDTSYTLTATIRVLAGYHTFRYVFMLDSDSTDVNNTVYIDRITYTVPEEAGFMVEPAVVSIKSDGFLDRWPIPQEALIDISANGDLFHASLGADAAIDVSATGTLHTRITPKSTARVDIDGQGDLTTAIALSGREMRPSLGLSGRLTTWAAQTLTVPPAYRTGACVIFTDPPALGYSKLSSHIDGGPALQSERLVSIGALARRLNETSPSLEFTLDNGDGRLVSEFSVPPLRRKVSVYRSYPDKVLFEGTVSQVRLGETVVVTLEG